MQQLILVRHGETIFNKKGCYCGWSDSPMTEKGLKDVQHVISKLKNEKVDCIICSDLRRTVKTAELISESLGINFTLDDKLREINFGSWEGLSHEEIKNTYPMDYEKWEKDWIDYQIPKGESLRHMYDRVISRIDIIIKKNPNKSILLVSHGGCIRAILAHFIGGGIKDYWKFQVSHGAISKLEISDGFTFLKSLNE